MTVYNLNCPPADCGPCGTLPSGFVRLRYFYGKRLAVADFLDEQRYHTGKLRFHEQRLHGSGVLCGLRTDQFSTDPADATILRVHRGAAIDGCGREIVVGWDQCIDVDAWLGRQLDANASFLTTATAADGTLPLCVVLRYRECPASPEAAPRDACSCDTSGCDYGRIREEFELDLIAKPAATIVPAMFPARVPLTAAIAAAPSGAAIVDQIAVLATAGCPAPDSDGWLEIACFSATLAPATDPTARAHVVSIGTITPAETILYETALLQDLLLRDLAATMEGGSLADGPQITSVALDSATNPQALLVTLSAPLVPGTVPGAPFALHAFSATAGWVTPPATVTTTYDNATTFTLTTPITAPAMFRLVSIVPAETPMVDAFMRPLRPLRFSFHFAIAKDATNAYSITAPPIS